MTPLKAANNHKWLSSDQQMTFYFPPPYKKCLFHKTQAYKNQAILRRFRRLRITYVYVINRNNVQTNLGWLSYFQSKMVSLNFIWRVT
jgi:hypothetical protein